MLEQLIELLFGERTPIVGCHSKQFVRGGEQWLAVRSSKSIMGARCLATVAAIKAIFGHFIEFFGQIATIFYSKIR